MSHTPHELAEEFPDKIETMHDLKLKDAHFSKLFDEYHEVNRAVHRAETRVDTIDEMAEEDLRKQRIALKDEIWSMICAAV